MPSNVPDRADDASAPPVRTQLGCDQPDAVRSSFIAGWTNQRYPTGRCRARRQLPIAHPRPRPAAAQLEAHLESPAARPPWGRSAYQYLSPGIKGEVDVMSLCADGQSGGEGKNADIGSWQQASAAAPAAACGACAIAGAAGGANCHLHGGRCNLRPRDNGGARCWSARRRAPAAL